MHRVSLVAPLLLFVLIAVARCGESAPPAAESSLAAGTPVILISVDTLRSDRLPMYGYDEIETPALDRLRADSVLFERAYSPVPLTLPAHTSILTGTDPDRHGIRSNVGYSVPADVMSLPRALSANGYQAGAAVSAWVLRSETGLGEHFDFYEDDVGAARGISFDSVQRPGTRTAELASAWIDERRESPFFLMLHLFEPHSPYEPPPELEGFDSPYDGEVVAVDRIVGGFLDRLRTAGLYDRALIVFLSDHGESLDEHGTTGHGIFLYREAIQVPLLIKLPDSARAGETINSPVSLIDVAPTILSLLGLEPSATMDGLDLFEPIPADRIVYGETMYPRLHLGWSELRSSIEGQHHYIEAPQPELYDLHADPAELHNLFSERRRVYATMREHLDQRPLKLENPRSADPEQAAKLAALGYLGSGADPGEGPLPDPKDKVSELERLMEAMRVADSGDRQRAISLFRQIVETDPNLNEAWLQLGRLFDQQGRWEESLDAYQTAMRAAPGASAETALSIAEILIRLERWNEAQEHVALAETVNPDRASLIRAKIAMARNDLETAIRESRAVPDGVYRDDADVLLAMALARDGDLAGAMNVVERAGRRAAENREVPPEGLLLARGDVLARMDRLEEASASFEAEIELHPSNLQAYANLALVSNLRGRPELGRRTIEEMVTRNPSRRARAFAIRTLEQLGDPEGAAAIRNSFPQ